MFVSERLQSIIHGNGTVRLRVDLKEVWDETFGRFAYQPVAYSNSSLDYQLAYQEGMADAGSWTDISLIIYWDDKPAALWPLSLSIQGGAYRLTSQGQPVLPPMCIADLPINPRKKIIKYCLNLANDIALHLALESWESGESFVDSVGLSEWHRESMERNALCRVYHELYQDLRPDLASIKQTFRKSYKSLIASGSRTWAVGVLDAMGSESVWQEFRDLHMRVAGRVTRSEQTWAMQMQDIRHQHAFLIWLRNSLGEMVGGGLFSFTRDEGLYSVGAYDRSLFDRPLGHVVQFRAMEELKMHGVRWYKIGARPYVSDLPRPSDKEISIGEFKQGFAAFVFPNYRLTHKVCRS